MNKTARSHIFDKVNALSIKSFASQISKLQHEFLSLVQIDIHFIQLNFQFI